MCFEFRIEWPILANAKYSLSNLIQCNNCMESEILYEAFKDSYNQNKRNQMYALGAILVFAIFFTLSYIDNP